MSSHIEGFFIFRFRLSDRCPKLCWSFYGYSDTTHNSEYRST